MVHLTLPVTNDCTYPGRARQGWLGCGSRRINRKSANYPITNRFVPLRPTSVTGYERVTRLRRRLIETLEDKIPEIAYLLDPEAGAPL